LFSPVAWRENSAATCAWSPIPCVPKIGRTRMFTMPAEKRKTIAPKARGSQYSRTQAELRPGLLFRAEKPGIQQDDRTSGDSHPPASRRLDRAHAVERFPAQSGGWRHGKGQARLHNGPGSAGPRGRLLKTASGVTKGQDLKVAGAVGGRGCAERCAMSSDDKFSVNFLLLMWSVHLRRRRPACL